MTRPNIDPSALVSSQEAWDALLRDILAAIAVTPFPVPQFADFASLPDPTAYDRCMATTADDDALYFSKAGVWEEVSFV